MRSSRADADARRVQVREGLRIRRAGRRREVDAQGELPEGSINRLVADKLAHFSALRKAFGASARGSAQGAADGNASDPAPTRA